MGTGDVATRSPRLIKGVFRAWGRMGKGSGAQLVFSILQVMGRDIESKRHAQDINTWLQDLCLHQNFVFHTHLRVFFKTQVVLGPDEMHCADGGTAGSALRQSLRAEAACRGTAALGPVLGLMT